MYDRLNLMKKYIYILIALLVLGGIIYVIMAPSKPGKYDEFATCLKDKGATFYGAFWCPHCQSQKARFGRSSSKLPYVECSLPDGQTQTEACRNAGVTTYPTWEFPLVATTTSTTTSERVTGEIELADLAQRTGCVLPE